MSSAGDGRRGFVLSLTLTELVLLMIFLLLLAAAKRIGDLNAEVVRATESVEHVAELEERLQELEDQREGYESLLEATEPEPLDDDFVELVRTAAANTGAAEERDRLVEANRALQAERDSARQQLERYAAGEGGVVHENQRLRDSISQLQGRVGDARAQVLNLQRRVGGLGFPPCWPDPEGRPEYIFTVRIEEGRLRVTRAWPPHRNQAVTAVSGASSLPGVHTSAEFAALALPVLQWSQRQDPECRHFVRIDDAPEVEKEAFKTSMLLIEDFFYKYLVR